MDTTVIVIVVMVIIAAFQGIVVARASFSSRGTSDERRRHELWKVKSKGYRARRKQLRWCALILLPLTFALPVIAVLAFQRFDETSTWNFSTGSVDGNPFLFSTSIICLIVSPVVFWHLVKTLRRLKVLRDIRSEGDQ